MVADVLNARAAAAVMEAPASRAELPARPLTLECLSGLEGLDALAPEWNGLVERAGLRHPFVTYEWVRPWCETQVPASALRFYVVRAGRAITGIAPIVEQRSGPGGAFLARRALSCPHTPRTDFVVVDRHDETYRLLWNAIAPRSARESLELRELSASDPTLGAIERVARERGFLVGRRLTLDSPWVPISGTYDQWERTLRRHFRESLRSRLRRLSRLGQVRFETVRTRAELPAALPRAFQLEAAAWKFAAGTAIVCRPELVRFYTRLAEHAADRGWLRLQFLTLDGVRIAFKLDLQYARWMYTLKTGYDPAYAAYSPGQLLFQMAFRTAFEEGLDGFDLLGAKDRWKLEWTRNTTPHFLLSVLPDTIAGRLAHALRYRIVPSVRNLRVYREGRDLYYRNRQRRGVPVPTNPEP